MKEKKYALALSGGGFKGAFQLGALRYLRENWKAISGRDEFYFDVICGVSAGSLNGILTACNKFDELEDLWQLVKEKGGNEIYESRYITDRGQIRLSFEQLKNDLLPGFKISGGMVLKGAWNALKRAFNRKNTGMLSTILKEAKKEFDENFSHFKSLATNKPLEEKLLKYVELDQIPRETMYKCGFVSLQDGNYYSFSARDFKDNRELVKAIIASTSMPIIWPPVRRINLPGQDKEILNSVDGGIRNISPLSDVVEAINADTDDARYEVFIINCNSGFISPIDEEMNIADIALRSLTEITLAEIFNDDIREFLKTNAFVKQANEAGIDLIWKGKAKRYYNYKLISPKKGELGETLDSRPEIIEKRINLGYRYAEELYSDLIV